MKKKVLSAVLALCMLLTLLPTALGAEITAAPNTSKVLVNGANTAFDAYTINQNNYFKLRDLAMALNGTAKQFDVAWDGARNAITLTTGKAYYPVGGELAPGDGTAKTANPGQSALYLDGRQLYLTAYTINQNNYFKLRDVMEQLNVYVGWDGPTSTITLDTAKGYEYPATPVAAQPEWLYFSDRDGVTGWEKDAARAGYLAKIRPNGTGYQVLTKDFANSMVEHGGWIYYLRWTTTDGWDRSFLSEIYRIKPDGSSRQQVAKVRNERVENFSIYDGKIYYASYQSAQNATDGKDRRGIRVMNLDGTGDANVFSQAQSGVVETWFAVKAREGRIYGIRKSGSDAFDKTQYNNLWSMKLDGSDLKRVYPQETDYKNIWYGDEWIYMKENTALWPDKENYEFPQGGKPNILSRIRYDGTGYTRLFDSYVNQFVVLGDWVYMISSYGGANGPNRNLLRLRTDGSQLHKAGTVGEGSLSTAQGMLFLNTTDKDNLAASGQQPMVFVFDGTGFAAQPTGSAKAAPVLQPGQLQAYPNYAVGPLLEKPVIKEKGADQKAADAAKAAEESAKKAAEEAEKKAALSHITDSGVADGWYRIQAITSANYQPRGSFFWDGSQLKINCDPITDFYVQNNGAGQFSLKTRDGKYLALPGKTADGTLPCMSDTPFLWELSRNWTMPYFWITPFGTSNAVLQGVGKTIVEGTVLEMSNYTEKVFSPYNRFEFIPLTALAPES